MTGLKATQAARSSHPFQTIARAGLLAGFLDGMDAVVYSGIVRGASPARVFRFIASGLLGTSALHGGWGTAALGCLLHFTIAAGAAATFYILSRKIPMLTRKPLLWGPVFGIGVFVFMSYLVVPLSAVPKQPSAIHLASLLNLIFSHIFFVGIPIAMVTAQAQGSRCLIGVRELT